MFQVFEKRTCRIGEIQGCRETTFRTKVSNLSDDVESRRQRRTEHDHGVQAHDDVRNQA